MPGPIPPDTVERLTPRTGTAGAEPAEPDQVTFADLERVLTDDANIEAVLAAWDGFL